MIMGDNEIDDNNKYTSNAGDFDCDVDAAVQCGLHRLMDHIPGFTRSQWILPLGECLRRISPAAAMVNEFFENTKHHQKTTFS
jgi:hypothetical protein